MPSKFDVVIIGAGPAGEGCAMRAAKQGKRVAVVDEKPSVGGNCAHLGTIPSKALRHSVRQIIRFNTDRMFRHIGEPKFFSFPQVLKRAEEIIQSQVDIRTTFYARNRIALFRGAARFTDKYTIEVVEGEGVTETLVAEQIVICTGSSPYRPDDIDFSDPLIFDSDTILKLDHTPRKILIFGAGVIGCEYASIFCGLGVRVELVDSRSRLLEFLDHEISDALSYHLRDQGALIRHSESYRKFESDGQYIYAELESGKRIRAEALLWCSGRTGNTRQLNIDIPGLEVNHRHQLIVDDHYRTNVKNIYGAGDVIGWPSLASAAYDQGRSVGSAITKEEEFYYVDDVPTGIYTIPEISSIGKTEEELTKERVPYEMGQAFFKTIARAQISGETVGMLKILFHRETLELLGIHCFGDHASEIVHIGQAIMNQKGSANSIEYFVTTTFNYPTMAEAYRVAALNGLHRVV